MRRFRLGEFESWRKAPELVALIYSVTLFPTTFACILFLFVIALFIGESIRIATESNSIRLLIGRDAASLLFLLKY